MSKLKSLKNIDDLTVQNYWNCCPLQNQFLPETVCKEGSFTKTSKPSCQWYIVSKEHNNCFWSFIKDRSYEDGSMPELTQSEVASLFGWSNAKVHFVFKEAIEALVEKLAIYGFINGSEDSLDLEVFSDQSVDGGYKPID